jgi:hypothetical protein
LILCPLYDTKNLNLANGFRASMIPDFTCGIMDMKKMPKLKTQFTVDGLQLPAKTRVSGVGNRKQGL